MGTNYYLKRIPTEEEIERTKNLLDQRKIESHSDCFGWDPEKDMSVQDMVYEMIREIHIGKYSGGWRFCFRVNDELYAKSYKSVWRFIENSIQSGKWKFINEYGDDIELKDFISLCKKYKNDKSYQDNQHPGYNSLHISRDTLSADGSWWCNTDFC